MATLLQILAKELKAWPKGKCKAIAQEGSSCVFFWKRGDLVFGVSGWESIPGETLLDMCGVLCKNIELAEDHETAIITKCMWKAEVAGMALGGKITPQANPLAWRDRIQNIDIVVQELEEERLSLVQSLEAEGFALIDAKREPAEDMANWRNWKAGDLVECVKEADGPAVLTVGCVYKLKDYRRLVTLIDDDGDHVRRCIREGCFKFVSRP